MRSVVKKKEDLRRQRVSVLMTKAEVKAIKKYLGGNVTLSSYFRDQILARLKRGKADE